MSIKVEMEFKPDPDFYSDILITAFDGQYGGCWYWCEPDRDAYSTDGPWMLIERERMAVGAGEQETWMAARIRERLDVAGQGAQPFTVDHDAIARGIERIVNGQVAVNSLIQQSVLKALREDDAGEIDSEVADCIVQAAALGRIVYG